jgi:hypothetical protein
MSNIGKALLSTRCVEFECLTAMVPEDSIFWYIMPVSPLKFSRHFGKTK